MSDFVIKDCALVTMATGRRAQTLRELRDVLRDVHSGCIYHHFWGSLLRPQFSDREYNNDFASWCRHSLHDMPAAERLSVIDPADHPDIETLRQELTDVIDERLDETEVMLFARADQQFNFVRSIIVVFDTHRRLSRPEDLVVALPDMSVGSIFYHFIDARRREPIGQDDFSAWLEGMGCEDDICPVLQGIEPYFESLYALRDRLSDLFSSYYGRPHNLDQVEQPSPGDRPSLSAGSREATVPATEGLGD